MCARYINALFHCLEQLPSPSNPHPDLAHFIAYALHHMRFTTLVAFAALYLLQRLKTQFIAVCGSSSHRLFISTYTIVSKVISDDTYFNKLWCVAGQGTFYLMEINQMECKVCSYLEWQLNVKLTTLQDFETMIRKDFRDSGPYLALYALPAPSPGSPTHPGPRANSIQVTTPSFRPNAAPFPPSTTSSIRLGERGSSISSYPAQTNGTYLPTPPVLHSDISPCNLMSPVTPQDASHSGTKIMSSTGLNTM